jgi:hypothetical protein
MPGSQVLQLHRYGLLDAHGDIDPHDRFGELLQKQRESLEQRLDSANAALTAIFDDAGLNDRGKGERSEESRRRRSQTSNVCHWRLGKASSGLLKMRCAPCRTVCPHRSSSGLSP